MNIGKTPLKDRQSHPIEQIMNTKSRGSVQRFEMSELSDRKRVHAVFDALWKSTGAFRIS
jgi:uncharacterized protein VirK/YbjX